MQLKPRSSTPRHETSRRDSLKAAALGVAGLAATSMAIPTSASPTPKDSPSLLPSHPSLEIESIDRTTVRVPYREVSGRNMARELPHWSWSEVFEIRLKGGAIGVGETLLFYTWGVSSDSDVKRALGRNAAELMWDDSLGPGIQIALFDAVARAAGVPVHALLGKKINDKTPLSWWNIDTSADDMALECLEAMRLGYRSYKTKGRPWFDIYEQVEKAVKVVPESFKIDMDFNDTLLDAKRGLPILLDLEKHPQIDIYESPIPQGDIEGNKQIRKATRVGIAMHYGTPKPVDAIREGVCDGFVCGGGASRLMRQGFVAEMADLKFWLQLVGTGITAAFSLHFGGVLSHATWPAVNCHQLYEHQLLAEPILVSDGFASVPDEPGLGIELDRDAMQKYKVRKPDQRPDPERLIETSWPDGRKMFIANNGKVNFMLTIGQEGRMPYYVRGANSRLVPDDGSAEWRKTYNRARQEAFMVK